MIKLDEINGLINILFDRKPGNKEIINRLGFHLPKASWNQVCLESN
jgi:hypothetical protein